MGKVLTFNEHSMLPDAAAEIMELPVASKGLREILSRRYAETIESIRHSNDSAPEKIVELKRARKRLQEYLNLIGACAEGFFRNNQVPADVACALLDAMTNGETDACTWKESDAIRGWALLKCTSLIRWRTLRNPSMQHEKDPDWRKLIFIRQVLLINELRGSIFELGVPGERVNPRNFPAYRAATELVWPKSPLSVHVATMAKTLRNRCNPVPRSAI